MKKYLNYAVWAILLVLTMSVVSCGDDDDPNNEDDPVTSELDSQISGIWTATYTENGTRKTETLIFVHGNGNKVHDHTGMRYIIPSDLYSDYGFTWKIVGTKLYITNVDNVSKPVYTYDILELKQYETLTLKSEYSVTRKFTY